MDRWIDVLSKRSKSVGLWIPGMGGWADGSMDGSTDGWMDRCIDGWIDRSMGGWISGGTARRTHKTGRTCQLTAPSEACMLACTHACARGWGWFCIPEWRQPQLQSLSLAHTHAHMHTHIHTHAHACMRVCDSHSFTHTHTRARTCARAHTHVVLPVHA